MFLPLVSCTQVRRRPHPPLHPRPDGAIPDGQEHEADRSTKEDGEVNEENFINKAFWFLAVSWRWKKPIGMLPTGHEHAWLFRSNGATEAASQIEITESWMPAGCSIAPKKKKSAWVLLLMKFAFQVPGELHGGQGGLGMNNSPAKWWERTTRSNSMIFLFVPKTFFL